MDFLRKDNWIVEKKEVRWCFYWLRSWKCYIFWVIIVLVLGNLEGY